MNALQTSMAGQQGMETQPCFETTSMTGHGMLRDESGRRTWSMQLGAWVSIRYAWALGRGMRVGAWWTAVQGQPCCGCKASDVHQAWGTWGMRVRQAELGLVLRARGMRGQGMCTSMAWQGIRNQRGRSTQGTAGCISTGKGRGHWAGGQEDKHSGQAEQG